MNNNQRPSPAQLRWQRSERGMFFHFGINTFAGLEWSDGSIPAAQFAPSRLDVRSWVKTARETGFRYAVLTAKHHDGFCLWPTKTTGYGVMSSPVQADIVGMFVESCHAEGIHPGLYLSPWDRNAACYSDAQQYDDFYAAQLIELCTGYGELFELWFDGAGSAGRKYDWPRYMDIVQRHQPNAMVFNMGRPTIRWVGNEDGLAPTTCWNRAQAARESMYTDDMATWLEGTPAWVPAECDVPIRGAHWFFHENDEGSLRSLNEMLGIHDRSVGHGANLLLNVSPDKRGLLPESDVQRLHELSAVLEQREHSALAFTKGDGESLVLPLNAQANAATIEEDIEHGECIREYVLEGYIGGQWKTLFCGESVGNRRIIHFDRATVQVLRLRVTKAEGTPRIRKFCAYLLEK